MKKGTQYAKKLKEAYGKFRGLSAPQVAPESLPPIDQLILAALSESTTIANAKLALTQIRENMVDYNELRVSTPAEIEASTNPHIPNGIERGQQLVELLNAIFKKEYSVSLDHLGSMGIREVKAYFESLEGITPYITASVLLWSLGGHAIPINTPTLEFLKDQDLVDPDATGAEVQAFLERHVSAADSKSFCLDLEAYMAANPAPVRVKKEEGDKKAKTTKKKTTKSKSTSKKTTVKKTAKKQTKTTTKKKAST